MSFSLGRGQVLQPGANCIKSEVSTLHRKESPLVDVLRTLWPSPIFLLPLKEPDLRNSTECARRKRHEYFSLPASREENFFYNLHEGFFFKELYVFVDTNQNVLHQRKGVRSTPPVPQLRRAPVRPEAAAASPSWEPRRQAAGASKCLIFKCT